MVIKREKWGKKIDEVDIIIGELNICEIKIWVEVIVVMIFVELENNNEKSKKKKERNLEKIRERMIWWYDDVYICCTPNNRSNIVHDGCCSVYEWSWGPSRKNMKLVEEECLLNTVKLEYEMKRKDTKQKKI